MEKIIVTGSIAYDYLMRFPGRFADHLIGEQLHQLSLSFLVEDMTKHWGGVAANVAYTLALLGLRPRLMATAGRDFGDYRVWLESAGVDTSTVRQIDEVFTASFFANTDLDNNQMSSFYTGAMSHARDYSLADAGIDSADLVLISPNDPLAMTKLAEECRSRSLKFIYDPSQQVARLSGDELLASMTGAYVMVVNAYEAEVIAKKTARSLRELCEAVEILVVTHGPRGAVIYVQQEPIPVSVYPVDEIKDPTGGGDAFRAGFIRGLAAGLPMQTCGQMGALCAAYVLENVGTQNHRFTIPEYIQRYREHFDDDGQLDVLLQPAYSGVESD